MIEAGDAVVLPPPGGYAERPTAALHSSNSYDWGTPAILRRFAACVLRPSSLAGAIDLDYTSSAYWHTYWPDGARPAMYLDGAPGRDVLVEADRRRALKSQSCGAGFQNPPGFDGGEMVQKCWSIFEHDHAIGWLGSGCWIGFSLEQLASLQGLPALQEGSPRSPRNPLSGELVVTIVPSRRARYELHPEQLITLCEKKLAKKKEPKERLPLERKIEALRKRATDDPVPGDSPTHASYVTFLMNRERPIRRRQLAAMKDFLRGQADQPRSLLQRAEVVGVIDA